MAVFEAALEEHLHQRSLIGKTYVLAKATVALRAKKPRLIHIPQDATVKVLSDIQNSDGTIEVLWAGDPVLVFKIDLERRGTEI